MSAAIGDALRGEALDAIVSRIAALQARLHEAEAERERLAAALAESRRWVSTLSAANTRLRSSLEAAGRRESWLGEVLAHAEEWLAEQGCDCGTDEPGTCALCEVRAALVSPSPVAAAIGKVVEAAMNHRLREQVNHLRITFPMAPDGSGPETTSDYEDFMALGDFVGSTEELEVLRSGQASQGEGG